MAAIRAASVVLIPTRASSSFSQAKQKNGASAKKSQNALSPSFAKTSSSVATRAIGMGHAAPQRREGDPFDPHASQRQHEPGSNVWHESPPMVNQQLDIIAPNGEHNSHANDDAEQYFDAGAPPPSSPFVNPNTPSYIYELESARVRCIELEARAVQERDYLTASKSAKHIERLVEIESEPAPYHRLLTHDTAEMEASLTQEYAAALTHKRMKELLLAEFEEMQLDLYGGTDRSQRRGGGGSGDGDGQAEGREGSSPAKAQRKKIVNLNTVPVRFSVNAQTHFGETVVVCGSIPELGAWEMTAAPEMKYSEGKKSWGITVLLPKGANFRFKFVIGVPTQEQKRRDDEEEEERRSGKVASGTKAAATKAKVVERDWYWQDGADRAIQMPLDEVVSMDVVVDWAGDSEKEKMWLCMPVPFAPPQPSK